MLSRALGNDLPAICCRTEVELWEQLARGSAKVFVIQIVEIGRPKPASLIAAVRDQFPTIRIVGYAWLSQALAAEIIVCARLGLDALALQGYCSLGTVIRRAAAECGGAEEAVLHDLMPWIPPALLEIVRLLLQRLDEAPNLNQLARWAHRSTRTLQRAAIEGGCCSPGELISATRVLVALRLFAVDALTMERVLERTGFRSSRALRATLRRFGLTSLTRVRGLAGYGVVRDALLRTISTRCVDAISSGHPRERAASWDVPVLTVARRAAR